MDTPASSAQPVQPVDPAPPKSTVNWPATIGIAVALVVILGGIAAGAYWFGTKSNQTPITILPTPTVEEEQTPEATQGSAVCTMEAKICPDGSSVGRIGPNCEFALCPTGSAKPTPKTNPSGKTFTSDILGIRFFYADTMISDKTSILTSEAGNKIYIYPATMKPESGQYVEVFQKDSKDSLKTAIEKKLLAGIPASECFVKIDAKGSTPTVTKATISYPVPTGATEPAFTYGDKCPDRYKESNGIAYFWYDSAYPNKYVYVSIGQYGIPAYNNTSDSMWQETLEFFK